MAHDESGDDAERQALVASIQDRGQLLDLAILRSVIDPLLTTSLTMPQLKILGLLTLYGSRTTGDLAQALVLTPTAVSGTVDRLVERYLVARREDSEDSRILRLELTAEGRRTVAGLLVGREMLPDEFYDRLAIDDLRALARGVSALRTEAERGHDVDLQVGSQLGPHAGPERSPEIGSAGPDLTPPVPQDGAPAAV